MGVYDGKSDAELVEMARSALIEVLLAPAGSPRRQERMAAHDAVVTELKLRLLRHVSRRLGLPDCEFSNEALAGLKLPL